jgi:hypothetical protein
MTLKGKKAKVLAKLDELSPDISVRLFLEHSKKFDNLVANKDYGGYLCFPYDKGRWSEDKLWFESKDKVLQFVKLFKNAKVEFDYEYES